MNSTSLISCSLGILQLADSVIENSGRGIFHRGHYQQCITTQKMKYSLVQFGINGTDTTIFTGLCLPQMCSDDLITKQIDSFLKDLQLPYSVLTLDSHTQDYVYEMNWLSYLTIFILVAIALLALVAIFRGRNRKENNQIIKCFDAIKNVKAHFKVREGEPLNVFDGVRAISMMWVVIGHLFSFILSGGPQNFPDYKVPTQKPFFLIIIMGLISVDIFFALGGFFLAFVILRQKKITAKLCLLGIVQRALRIWPAYILTMIFYYSLFMRLGSGMFWSRIEIGSDYCRSMWRQIFFISNFVENGDEQCLGWGWYLQVDFQLFIIGLMLLYLNSKYKKPFLLVSGLLCTLSIIYNYTITYNLDIRILTDLQGFANFGEFMLDLYIKPYGRCTPYIIGLIVGVYYMEYKNSLKKQKQNTSLFQKIRVKFLENDKLRKLLQWLGIAIMAFFTFIPRILQTGSKWPQEVHSLYWALSKPLFIIAMFMTTLPSILGIRHSFFELILNSKALMVIARVSFCTYLVHLMVINQYIYVQNLDFYYDNTNIFIMYLGILVLSLVFGFLLTVLVEVPFANLLKLLMTKQKKGQSERGLNSPKESLITSESLVAKESIVFDSDQKLGRSN